MSKARAKGTSFEVDLLDPLRIPFGPTVERAPLKGINDHGDFINVPLLVEAKNQLRPSFMEWARTAEKKTGNGDWWIAWKGDARKSGNGPYVLMPLGLAIRLATEATW